MQISLRTSAMVAIGFGVIFLACSSGRVAGTGGTTTGMGGTTTGTGGTTTGTGGTTTGMGGTTTGMGGAAGSGGTTSTTTSSSSGGGADAGDAGCPGDPYPAGPYGIAKDAVVPNLSLQGFADALDDGTTTAESFSLGDFYNPTGTEVFPACSPLGAGKAEPKALLLFIAAVWASPANQEAKAVLPSKHATVAPAGGQFVTVLVDGPTPGVAATVKNLTNWVNLYKVDYPSGILPGQTIPGLAAFPTNVLVDTRTMKVVDVVEGAPVSQACADGSPCTTAADCQGCAGGMCVDFSSCTTASDCASQTCIVSPFWPELQMLLGLDGGL